jgi:hypothetical protein
MDDNQRFSILTFPQFFDGTDLGINIVFLPRNQNPLTNADGVPPPSGAPPFADARLSFVARIVSGLSGLPGTVAPLAPVAIGQEIPAGDLSKFVQFRRAPHAQRGDRRCLSLRRARGGAKKRVHAAGR